MCGAVVGDLLRRTRSVLELAAAADGGPPALNLKAAKSFSDLRDLGSVLDGERLGLERSSSSGHIGDQCSSDDTGRSSPTSGYEQLLRSRSPCAVLFADDQLAAQPPALSAPAAPAAAAVSSSKPEAVASRATGRDLPPLPSRGASPPLPPRAYEPVDTPFLESAAAFSVVEVQAAAAAARADTLFGPGHARRRSEAPAAAADPICAAAASQSAFAAAAAAVEAAGGSSGAPSLGGSPPSSSGGGSATSGLTAAVAASPFSRVSLQDHPSVISPLPSVHAPGGSTAASSAGSSPTHRGGSAGDLARRGSLDGWGTSAHLTEGHAAEELFYRLNHARQTVEFVKRQATAFSALNKAACGVWEALGLLDTLREYETALLGEADPGGATPDMPLLEHALQCAESCRAAFPDEPWMHVAGLLAPLGKLLAHAKWGAEPQWAICGETFPVGCRFHPAVRHSQYFSANPDRRKRLYSSPSGVYREGCGLGSVLMSWGAGEYLHLVLRLNRVPLPAEALFCLRHQKLRCVFRPGAPYSELLSEFDRVQLPRLAKFQALCAYRRAPRAEPLLVPGGEPDAAPRVAPELKAYYDALLAQYIPQGTLRW